MGDFLELNRAKKNSLSLSTFDGDKELQIYISDKDGDEANFYALPHEVNDIICHLAKQLKAIGEPCDLLDKVI